MTATECKLGSIIVHLAEFIETGEPVDMGAARGVMADPDVREFFERAMASALLPEPRQELVFLK